MKKPALQKSDIGESAKPIIALLFGLSSITILDLGNLTIQGFSLSGELFTLGDIAVSNAAGIAVLAVVVGYTFSNRDINEFTDTQSYIAYAVLLSVGTLAVAPTLRDAIVSSEPFAWTVFGIQLIGYGVLTGMHDMGGSKKNGGWFR